MEIKYYAILDNDNIVVDVIQTTEESRNNGMHGPLTKVIETDPNAVGGRYFNNFPPMFDDTKQALRKNFARVGFKYDPELDAFIPPSPYPSWVLDTEFCVYLPPVPKPDDDGYYEWNEGSQNWSLVENQENQ